MQQDVYEYKNYNIGPNSTASMELARTYFLSRIDARQADQDTKIETLGVEIFWRAVVTDYRTKDTYACLSTRLAETMGLDEDARWYQMTVSPQSLDSMAIGGGITEEAVNNIVDTKLQATTQAVENNTQNIQDIASPKTDEELLAFVNAAINNAQKWADITNLIEEIKDNANKELTDEDREILMQYQASLVPDKAEVAAELADLYSVDLDNEQIAQIIIDRQAGDFDLSKFSGLLAYTKDVGRLVGLPDAAAQAYGL